VKVPLIYKERPLFGFDLGSNTAKVVQLRPGGKTYEVLGYGFAEYPSEALVEGIVVDPEEVAKALKPLIKQAKIGHIEATRVAISLPTAKVFTRMLQLPPMSDADLDQAIRLEAEQYVPVPITDLYIDYEITEREGDKLNVLMVAAPRAIVDSYLKLFDILGLEVMFVESSLSAVTRALVWEQAFDTPTMVADIGSHSIDLTIVDHTIRLTDTIAMGGDDLTTTLMKELKLSHEQATEIKYKFGIGPSAIQPKVVPVLTPLVRHMVDEIKRVLKYYADKQGDKQAPVGAMVLAGGSASMPGLVDYLKAELGIEIRVGDPWKNLKIGHLAAVTAHEAPMYTTAIGLALLEHKV
jgi:type IV pilus assembly protein PilM